MARLSLRQDVVHLGAEVFQARRDAKSPGQVSEPPVKASLGSSWHGDIRRQVLQPESPVT